jgi:thiamine kinase-like enzyme
LQTSIQTDVERIGDEIHRVAGPFTPQVHIFLNFLHNEGFRHVPKPLGFDQEGREILSFVKGEPSENIRSFEALISSAKLLRSYHDVSQKFLNGFPCSESWMFPSRDPQEVICHNDFAPYNICFEGNHAVGIIDFDTASPGPRIWDIAYALYRFSPFTNPHNEDGFGTLEDQISRAKMFCNAYGLELQNRIGLADLIIERLQNLLDFLLQSAAQGHKKYELNLKDGHHLKYQSDLEYIKLHKRAIQHALKTM